MTRTRFSPARLLAYEVLRDVDTKDAFANLALQTRLRATKLSAQDAAFATELVSGTLRLAGRYDAILEIVTRRSVSQLDPEVHSVLRLGAHQLLTLDTPAHAAIHEQVELAKHVAGQRTAGFVNGVLRTISRTTPEEWLERIAQRSNTERERLARVHSHPEWVVDALAEALSAHGMASELEVALAANNESPKVHLAYLSGEPPEEAQGISPLGDELASGNPGGIIREAARTGDVVRVQDQGSQLAALALVHAAPIQQGETWLDLCAGPGGKTAVLATAAERAGASLRANEVAPHRADLVRAAVAQTGVPVPVVAHDGREASAYDAAEFDRIMIDAPCTGLGALRRRPEARWRKRPEDVDELTTLQRELLEAATAHLAPGGIIAYVTCSPHLAETRGVLDAHLAAHAELTELDAKSVVNAIARVPVPQGSSEALSVQLWPHRDGTDAMFISLMRKQQGSCSRTM